MPENIPKTMLKEPEAFFKNAPPNLARVEMAAHVGDVQARTPMKKVACQDYHLQVGKARRVEYDLVYAIYLIDKETWPLRLRASESGARIGGTPSLAARARFLNQIAKRQRLVDILGYDPVNGRPGDERGKLQLSVPLPDDLVPEEGKVYLLPHGVEVVCAKIYNNRSMLELKAVASGKVIKQSWASLSRKLPSGAPMIRAKKRDQK